MSENEQNNHLQEVNDHITVVHDHKPYWTRIHYSWIFWVFLFLMFASIIYYIISVDFAFAPQKNDTAIVK
jgi:hypothetical protein